MLGLPPLAVLAAFALPTLQRSTAAAIDWFSVFFFTIAALTIWVVYVSIHTGVPAQPAANIARLAPGYVPSFSVFTLALAALATIAWLWLVKWRTGRNRHPLWKSLVLPASGVALCWLLVMTLLLPPLDQARSYRSLVQRVAKLVPAGACIAAPGVSRAQVVALEYLGGFQVDAVTPAATARCEFLLLVQTRQRRARPAPAGSCWRASAATPATTKSLRCIGEQRPRLADLASAAHPRRREHEAERRSNPPPGSLSITELAAVALHHVLDDGQAQPGAAGLARAAAVDAVEALGQARQVLARDAQAGVADRDLAGTVGQLLPGHSMRPPSGV